MLKREIKIVNRLGLHARASAKVVQLASRFTSNVALVFKEAPIYSRILTTP